MDIVTLFTEQRWNILRFLSEEKYSPLQLAEKSNTTMANISQQLRLLEASNLVKKEKISNRDKGKPRTLFSISDDYAYIISAMKGFADKKLMILDDFHKILFRTWFIEDKNLRNCTEKFILGIEPSIGNIDLIIIKDEGGYVKVLIASKNLKSIDKKIKDTAIKNQNNETKDFKVDIIPFEQAEKFARQGRGLFSSSSGLNIIYDPFMLTSKLGKKGGSEN